MQLIYVSALTLALVVLVLMLVFFLLGSRLYVWRKRKLNLTEDSKFGAVEGSLLGLLALMLAFTFSLSNSHYDRRIQVVNEEANAIGTAILRADLYPDSIRNEFRKDLRQYLETRIEYYEARTDLKRIYASLDSSTKWQKRIWARAAYYAKNPVYLVQSNQMVPALNSMIDIVTTRNTALLARVPDIIFYTLFILCLTSAFTLGYSIGHKLDWPIKLGFAIMISLTLYLAIDLDRARRGTITIDFVEQHILDLRQMFTEE